MITQALTSTNQCRNARFLGIYEWCWRIDWSSTWGSGWCGPPNVSLSPGSGCAIWRNTLGLSERVQGRTWYSLNPLLIIIFPIKIIKWSEWQWWFAIILIHSQTRLSFLWRIFQLPGFRRRSRTGCADVTASLDGCQSLRSTARETAPRQRVVPPNPWVSSWLRTGHWRGWDTQGPMCCFIQSGMVHCNLTESRCNKSLQKALKLLAEDCYAHTRSGGRVLMTIHREAYATSFCLHAVADAPKVLPSVGVWHPTVAILWLRTH